MSNLLKSLKQLSVAQNTASASPSIKRGSIVEIATDFGTGKLCKVIVDTVEDDVKNGRAGITYSFVDNVNDGGWCYDHQIKKVISI